MIRFCYITLENGPTDIENVPQQNSRIYKLNYQDVPLLTTSQDTVVE